MLLLSKTLLHKLFFLFLKSSKAFSVSLTLFRISLFRAAHGWVGGGGVGSSKSTPSPFPKICHTYPTMMKLGTVIVYLKKIQKYMNHVSHPLSSADVSFFCHQKSANFAMSRNINKDCILIHKFLFF